jgi:nicotinate-nucleotide adenylyltransferase
MATLAITGNDHFICSDLEAHRAGKSYTIETMRELKKQNPESAFYFILGLDAFLEVESWFHWQELFAETNFIVTTRPGSPKVSPAKIIPQAVRAQFKWHRREQEFIHASGKKVVFTPVTAIGISASMIRQMVREGQSIRYLTPRRVREYIMENGLYQK